MEDKALIQELIHLIMDNQGKTFVKISPSSLKHYSSKEDTVMVLSFLRREQIGVDKSDSFLSYPIITHADIEKKSITLYFHPKVPDLLKSEI